MPESFFPSYTVYGNNITIDELNTKISDEIYHFFKKKRDPNITFVVIEFKGVYIELKNYEEVLLSNICFKFILSWNRQFMRTLGSVELMEKTIKTIPIANKIWELSDYKKILKSKNKSYIKELVSNESIKTKKIFNDPIKQICSTRLKDIIYGYENNVEICEYNCMLRPLISLESSS
jgi:hypothetical protein